MNTSSDDAMSDSDAISNMVVVSTMLGETKEFPVGSVKNTRTFVKEWLGVSDVWLYQHAIEYALKDATILTPGTAYFAIPRNPEFDTSLLSACWRGNTEYVGNWIERGADVNAVDPNNHYTPLHYAVSLGLLPMTQLIIDNHPDVNVMTDTGLTPVHIACLYGLDVILTILLDTGADMTIIEATRGTPLHIAIGRNKSKCADILRSYGAVE